MRVLPMKRAEEGGNAAETRCPPDARGTADHEGRACSAVGRTRSDEGSPGEMNACHEGRGAWSDRRRRRRRR